MWPLIQNVLHTFKSNLIFAVYLEKLLSMKVLPLFFVPRENVRLINYFSSHQQRE